MNTPILFLHGALATHHQFDSIRQKLPDTCTHFVIDLPGHGGKPIPASGLNFDSFAQEICSFLDDKAIPKVQLFGFSMGGYAAYYFASKYPDRVERIMSINVKFKWDPVSTAKEIGLLDPSKMLEKIPAFANNLMVQHGMHMWKQLLNSTSDMMQELSKGFLLTDEDLKKISCPVLLAIGDRDRTSSINETLDLFNSMKDASLWVIPNTAHPFEKISEEAILLEINRFFV